MISGKNLRKKNKDIRSTDNKEHFKKELNNISTINKKI